MIFIFIKLRLQKYGMCGIDFRRCRTMEIILI